MAARPREGKACRVLRHDIPGTGPSASLSIAPPGDSQYEGRTDVFRTSALTLSRNMRGALFMSVSMAGFTINDAITKTVSDSMNMGQIMLLRGIFASLMIAVLAWTQGVLAGWRRPSTR